jgi:hypothetical protein
LFFSLNERFPSLGVTYLFILSKCILNLYVLQLLGMLTLPLWVCVMWSTWICCVIILFEEVVE